MDDPQKTLADEIVKMTEKYWADEESPYLLAELGPKLGSYRDIIAPLTLKQFASGLSNRIKVVQHSSKKAKIGLIPAAQSYSFDQVVEAAEAAQEVAETKSKERRRSNKYVVLNFLQALATLDDEDLRGVVIPASVLAKLVKEK